MNLLNTLKMIDKSNWKTALSWLRHTILIGLVPIWVGIVIAFICSPESISLFVDRAQLALYSTAFLATGFYIVGRDFENVRFPGRSWAQSIMVVLLILAVAVYFIMKGKCLYM